MSGGRSIWRMIINNMINSVRLLPPKGKLVGTDHLGNKYYQAAKNPYSNRKDGNRWFEPQIKDDWQQDLPAEWEAWLRGRRRDVPSEEEVMQNLTMAQMKKIKGDEIAERDKKKQHLVAPPKLKGFSKFDDLETQPGQLQDTGKKYKK